MELDMALYNKAFVTGCDENHEWMIEWFLDNFKKHNKLPIIFADFGVSKKFLKYAKKNFNSVIDMTKIKDKGWFKKPKSMIEASKLSSSICWIDTDIQILKSIDDIFIYVEPNKLAMVEDKPWTKRRGDSRGLQYYNSGIVAFKDSPVILHQWAKNIEKSPQQGDQEVLHSMMESPLNQRIYISDIPNEYNWLRLQLEHDNQDSSKKKTIHWTGPKGKEKIKKMMRI
jgi:hypothetical protein